MKIKCVDPGVWTASDDGRTIYVNQDLFTKTWIVDDVEQEFRTLKEALEYIRRVCFGENP